MRVQTIWLVGKGVGTSQEAVLGPAMYDLTIFALSGMGECGAALGKLGGGAGSLEEVAAQIVGYLNHHRIGLEKVGRARAPVGLRGADLT